jgi:membrane fusion protein, multidrug efflux system
MKANPQASLLPLLSFGLALPLFAGCEPTAANAAPPSAAPGSEVATTIVAQKAVPRYLTLTGSLIPNQDSDVAADGVGKVVQVFVERGSFVKAGAPLVRLDARNAELSSSAAKAALEIAKAERTLAQKECDRADMLFKERAISSAEHDRSRTACEARGWSIEAASTQARIAEKALGDTIVRAPFAGQVADRYVSVGEFVGPGAKVATLLELEPIRLELSVPEAALPAIKEGQNVEFEVAGYPGERFTGSVRYLGPAVRRASRDQLIEAVVENHDRRLRPGMFATARIGVQSAELPLIPATAIKKEGTSERIFVVKAGRLEERLVQIGERSGDQVAIENGVAAGEHVVTSVTAELKDGLAVR